MLPTKMVCLDSDAIRRVATQTGCREIGFNPKLKIIVFRTRSENVQVNIFYSVGTVCVTLQHPRQGQIQAFQYGVEMMQLAEILTDPLDRIGCGYTKLPIPRITTALVDEETALRNHLEVLDREAALIAAEKEELETRATIAGYAIPIGGLRMSNECGSEEVNERLNHDRTPIQHHTPPHHPSKGLSSSKLGADDDDSDSESQLDSVISDLLRQQSDVNAQLERLLVSRKKNSKTASISRDQRRPRSSSAKRSHSASGTKSMVKAAPGDSPGDEGITAGGKKIPFKAQRSVVNPLNSSTGNHVTAAFRQRGNQCCYALCKAEYHKEFGAAWSAKPANVVALGRGYVILYDDGSVTWWDVPKLLDDKLKEQGSSSQAVRYLALGCDENYYIKFVDGKMEWCGPDSIGNALRNGIQKSRLLVDKVAFGPNQAWLILWSDGNIEYERIPSTLEVLLRERGSDQHVKDISIGPNEEWFVIFKDNSVRADNLPDSLYRILTEIQESGGRVRQVIFGDNSSWYVRYWDGKS